MGSSYKGFNKMKHLFNFVNMILIIKFFIYTKKKEKFN